MGRFFPPKQPKPGSQYQPILPQATIMVPGLGSSLIAAGASNTFRQHLGMPVKEFRCDVPLNMTASLRFDGREVHAVGDSQGSGATVPFDETLVNLVELVITNNSGAAQNVRYYIICKTVW